MVQKIWGCKARLNLYVDACCYRSWLEDTGRVVPNILNYLVYVAV